MINETWRHQLRRHAAPLFIDDITPFQGNHVLIVSSQHDHDRVKRGGANVNPTSRNRIHLANSSTLNSLDLLLMLHFGK